MNEFVLDYKTWICGGPSANTDEDKCCGKGSTRLLNIHGYKCCLGQFASQLGVSDNNLLGICEPQDIKNFDELLPLRKKRDNYDWHVANKERPFNNTDFSARCMTINDDESSTIKEKVRELNNECNEIGKTLVLTNFPANLLV